MLDENVLQIKRKSKEGGWCNICGCASRRSGHVAAMWFILNDTVPPKNLVVTG